MNTFRSQTARSRCPARVPLLATLLLWPAAAMAQQAPPTVRVNSCNTAGCHADVTTHQFVHDPVAQQQCFECHTYASAEQHTFNLTKPIEQLCITCHEPSHTDTVVHKPVADGNCLACHDPHGSDHRQILTKDPARGLCLDCHQEDYNSFKFVHGPVAVGACAVCHDSHSSEFPSLLTASPTTLCAECHEGQTPSEPLLWPQHKPMDDGCGSCHDPHASNSPFQLASATTQLCMTCHEDVSESITSAHVVHGPLTTENGCVQCHDPHFSMFEHLQQSAQPDLCLSCHDQTIKTEDGRVLSDMKTLLEENTNHHGPIRQGSCTACHQPHASQENTLLTQAYPPEFYAPFEIQSYQLCFTCHQADLVRDESGTGLTNFRDGDENLHWLHVNREKGRTCRACHEVHASSHPFHVRDAVPFGSKGWMLEINFQAQPEGGSCAPACHIEKTYSRTVALEEPIGAGALLDAPKAGATPGAGAKP